MSGGSLITPLADMLPLSEAGTARSGSEGLATRADHQHPRLTSATTGVLNASGEATVVFTRTFPTKPSVSILYSETADGQPVVFKVKSWVQTGSDYTGCVIKGYRSTTVPQNLATLLLGAVFNLFAGSASGVEYSLIAVQAS